MVRDFAEALHGGADGPCALPCVLRERSPERVNRRNGYRERDWDPRAGSIELALPKLREESIGRCKPRRRAEQAFLVGDRQRLCGGRLDATGPEARAAARGRADVESQVSRLAKSLDQIVEDFRIRPPRAARPYPYASPGARRGSSPRCQSSSLVSAIVVLIRRSLGGTTSFSAAMPDYPAALCTRGA